MKLIVLIACCLFLGGTSFAQKYSDTSSVFDALPIALNQGQKWKVDEDLDKGIQKSIQLLEKTSIKSKGKSQKPE